MSYKKLSTQLVGTKHILRYLGIKVSDIARTIGVSFQHFWYISTGERSCSLAVLEQLALQLCCTPNDLLAIPSPARLSEIRIAYLTREIETERQKFLKLKSEQDLADIATAEGEAA